MKIFGYHFRAENEQGLIDSVDGAIKYLAPLGLTHLIIEINNAFRFKSHPEISSSNITASTLSNCCDKLRNANIEPIPLYNCIGHQGWKYRNSLLKAYPEFDETPDIPDEKLIAPVHERVGYKWLSTYTPAWCCNEPKVYDVVIPALDELAKATKCKTIHLGMDEIFLFGQCERCKGLDPADLFRDNLIMLYNHFKEKGVSVMIWGDRLLNATKLLGEDGPHRARYEKDFENVGTSKCISEIPKDIIICDWHYKLEETYPSSHELLSHGFEVWPSCWFSETSAEAFWNYSLKTAKELNKEHLLPGMLVTGWGIRPINSLFSAKHKDLNEKEQQILKTFERVSKLIKDYKLN
ncbi:MAG: hypothetical protein J6R29_05275 [Clostridia bacterium]|nr:hypothetical protein [Clostridia bacterium]